MPSHDPDFWSSLLRRTLQAYDQAWLRQVASKLVRPRNQWPVEELIDRALGTVDNPAVIDRRVKDLEAPARQTLALIGHSRQPCWAMGNLIELLMALGHEDGVQPIRDLVETGLLFPTSPEVLASAEAPAPRLRGFDQWLAGIGSERLLLFAPPLVAARAIGEDFGLPDLSQAGTPQALSMQESDGLEWPLRLAALWQQVAAIPLRRTQQGGFFKRDLERLSGDPLVNGPAADQMVETPGLGFLLADLAERLGILDENEGELQAGQIPARWENGLALVLEDFFKALPQLRTWTPRDGWLDGTTLAANPFASAELLALLLLARLPEGAFALPGDLESWIQECHPYWAGESLRPSHRKPWAETFLLGVAYPLRLVQVAKNLDGPWLVRLTPTGRWLLGLGEVPQLGIGFPQTLTVQPNLEIIAFRQGLNPGLIAQLSRFAAWKSLGAACTLQLEPESVYRALEAGDTFDSIRLTLEQHGTRTLPPAVLDSLRTWSNKRDRITVFPSAMLLEFDSPADLNEALSRGVPAVRIGDSLAVIASEADLDYRHFRLTGTRDYALPPEKCASVEADGVTIVVDTTRSDLLLETELPRFAESVQGSSSLGKRFRLTPASLAAARDAGFTLGHLETWFHQRCGLALPPAARLLMTGSQAPPSHWRRHLAFHVATPEMADGLMQWPATRVLVEERLGPTALAVKEENQAALRQKLHELGIVEGGASGGDQRSDGS